jgi:predicted metal-dependent peptidase
MEAPGHRGTRAIQRMVEFAPATGGLALWVRHQDLAPDLGAPPIATDGTAIFYGSAFERLPLPLKTGLVAHEVLHIALRHVPRYLELRRVQGDVDLELYNCCADALVNSTLGHLGWLALPGAAVTLERLLAEALGITQDAGPALLEWDVERLYRAIDDRRREEDAQQAAVPRRERRGAESPQAGEGAPRAGARADGPKAARVRALGSGSGTDLLPTAASSGRPELEAEEARTWAERILRAHAGDGSHSMLRALIADLPQTRTRWELVLRSRLSHALAPRRALSWSRPSRSYLANQGRAGAHRRLPWEPGYTATRAVPRLAVIVDVSGSIDDELMTDFGREIAAISRRVEAAVVLVIGDDRVQRVQDFEPGRATLGSIEFHGRGGTDFTPLLEEADRHRPDLGVVLTDLDGPVRFRPRWPVIWAVREAHAGARQPFGRKLVLR